MDVEALKKWFIKNARSLPWRNNPTPYAVWISEVMLQQTQVAVVKDYYLRWMQRFPTIRDLAFATEEEVIKLWEGLGYYSRARNIHQAAQVIVRKHAGELPKNKEDLAQIRGLGPYTIGAILSFAYHQKIAAVDGNTIRVVSRYFGISGDVQESATIKKIWGIAYEILPDRDPWLIVEGLIELGALVCKKDPLCWECPLKEGCFAFREDAQTRLPKKEKKTRVTSLSRDVYVIVHKGSVLLKRGVEGKVMAGLYEFPYLERKDEERDFPFPFAAKEVKKLSEVIHSFTRFRVKLFPALWQAEQKVDVLGYQWILENDLSRYPFSSGHKKIMKELLDASFTY